MATGFPGNSGKAQDQETNRNFGKLNTMATATWDQLLLLLLLQATLHFTSYLYLSIFIYIYLYLLIYIYIHPIYLYESASSYRFINLNTSTIRVACLDLKSKYWYVVPLFLQKGRGITLPFCSQLLRFVCFLLLFKLPNTIGGYWRQQILPAFLLVKPSYILNHMTCMWAVYDLYVYFFRILATFVGTILKFAPEYLQTFWGWFWRAI